jgi:6-phosphogluconolactonase
VISSGPSAPSELAVVADSSTGLSVYAIDPASGSLTPVAGSPFAAGAVAASSSSIGGASVAVTPNHRFVYALSSM